MVDIPIINLNSPFIADTINWWLVLFTFLVSSTIVIRTIIAKDNPVTLTWNLFRNNTIKFCIKYNIYPGVIRLKIIIIFIIVTISLFFGLQNETHPGLIVIWIAGWYMVMLLFIFGGRIWCSVCPVLFISLLLPGRYNLKINNSIATYLALLFFALLSFLHYETPLAHQPVYSAIFLVIFFFSGLCINMLSSNYSWCNNICPLLIFGKAYSGFSALIVKSNHMRESAKNGKSTTNFCPAKINSLKKIKSSKCIYCMNCISESSSEQNSLYLCIPFQKEKHSSLRFLKGTIVLFLWAMLTYHCCRLKVFWNPIIIQTNQYLHIPSWGINLMFIIFTILIFKVLFGVAAVCIENDKKNDTYYRLINNSIPLLLCFHIILIFYGISSEFNWVVYCFNNLFSLDMDVIYYTRDGMAVWDMFNEKTLNIVNYILIAAGTTAMIVFNLGFKTTATKLKSNIFCILLSLIIGLLIYQQNVGGGC